VGCGTAPKQVAQQHLLWNKVLTAYEARQLRCFDMNDEVNLDLPLCKVSQEEAEKSIQVIDAYELAAKTFNGRPELSACEMAKAIEFLAPLVNITVPPLDEFCGVGVDEIDIILAGEEAKKLEGS
jgi:hypothetical protein